jgi:hypothetical protein
VTRSPGVVTLPLVIGLVVLVFLMGFSGSYQVSSARAALERIYARRLLHVVASSAFEEVCARLEGWPACAQIPVPDRRRDLGAAVLRPRGLPASIAPVLTRSDAEGQGVVAGDVSIAISPFRCEITPEPAGTVVQELGIVELALPVSASVGATTLRQTFVARRYADAVPDIGSGTARLRIQNNNIALKVR